MARKPKGPWFWQQAQVYCVTIEGKRHKLGADLKAATTRFHSLMAQPSERVPSDSVRAIVDLFLDFSEKQNAPLTYEFYRKHLQSFVDSLKPLTLPMNMLKPHHVESWADSHGWGPSYKRGALTAVARAFNWAFKKGHIPNNPIWKKLDKPPAQSREVSLTPAQFKQLLKHTSGDFKDLITVAWETGCRPREVMAVEARHVDLTNARWVFSEKESKGKRDKRVVYLSDKALAITKRLMAKRKKGPLFLFGDRPWDRFAAANHFRRLNPILGMQYRLYDFRFSFCTNGLKNGVDPITMQHLMGHKDLSMISKIYALVSQDVSHMRAAAKRATG